MEKKERNRKEKATKEFPMTKSLGWLIVPVETSAPPIRESTTSQGVAANCQSRDYELHPLADHIVFFLARVL